jgi:4'-phosphopantetheinyl transferase EntD
MLKSILPPDVTSCEAHGDIEDPCIFAEELALVEHAIDSRRREFATTRWCAHRALAALGEPRAPLLADARGAPIWPAGTVGSLTHCTGFRAAVAARSTAWRAIGIDAEIDGPLPSGVLQLTARPAEIRQLAALAGHDGAVNWERLMFSCKEAVFKAWYSMAGTWLDFGDVELSLGGPRGTFTAHVSARGPEPASQAATSLAGRWTVGDGLLTTATLVPHPLHGGPHR